MIYIRWEKKLEVWN